MHHKKTKYLAQILVKIVPRNRTSEWLYDEPDSKCDRTQCCSTNSAWCEWPRTAAEPRSGDEWRQYYGIQRWNISAESNLRMHPPRNQHFSRASALSTTARRLANGARLDNWVCLDLLHRHPYPPIQSATFDTHTQTHVAH